MKFSEKLQTLRKEGKLSQESFADMLDVSRQAVSKWESGQTYPEMDKLIAMCKIFNCSLDDLTNDEIKEIKATNNNKTTSYGLIDEVLETINKTMSMFKAMSIKEISTCIITMIVVFIFIMFLHIPIEYIYRLGENIFINFGTTTYNILSSIWYFLLEVAYLILSFILFIYIYKIRFLDNFKDKKEIKIPKDEIAYISNEDIKKEKIEKKTANSEEYRVKENANYLSNLFKVLGNIFVFLLKVFTTFISLPFLFIFCFAFLSLVVWFCIIFQGLFYFGILFLIIATIAIDYIVLESIYHFITNKPIFVHRMFYILIGALALLGIGSGLTMFDVASITYKDIPPESVEITSQTKEFKYTDKLLVLSNYHCNHCNSEIEYIKDETLKDTVKVEIKYYKDFRGNIEIKQSTEGTVYFNMNYEYDVNPIKYFNLAMKELKSNMWYNYSMLNQYDIIVYGNEKTIKDLEKRTNSYYEELMEVDRQNEINQYQNIIYDYQEEINKLNYEIDEYRSKISEYEADFQEYETEIQEYKDKIKEYKDQINNILE